MWILLPKGTVPQAGDEFLTGIGFGGQPCWKPVDSGMWFSSDAALRRELTGWEAVKHALKAEVLGNNKEGCETIPWMWECGCKKDFLHVYSEFGRCGKCGMYDSDAPDARKAEVILKIIEEKRPMGLDSHVYEVHKDGATESREELMYWRKNWRVHNWARRLYQSKIGETGTSFNCVDLELTRKDLTALRRFLKASKHEQERYTGFIDRAREALDNGGSVVFMSWY